MHRIDSSGATIGGQFKGRTPAPATKVTPEWLNDVQENLVAVILAAGLTLEKGNYGQLLEALRGLCNRPGTIIFWGGDGNVPYGTLHCDGSPLLKAEWPVLWGVIGNTWGDPPDADHFMLPDMRGRVPRGWDGSPAAGRDPGRLYGTYQDDQFGAHTHVVGGLDPEGRSDAGSSNVVPIGGGFSDVNSGSAGGAETRMKNAAGLFLIQAI